MNAIFLSGQSLSNKDWIERVEKKLHMLFNETKILYYNHWQSGGESIDFKKELAKLPNLVSGLPNYIIFAKSIGTVLVAKGVFDKTLLAQRCIFIGPAWLIGEEWIKNYSVPTLFVTKTNDPVAPAAKLRELLEKNHFQNYEFLELPGEDHKYDDLEQIKDLVTKFIK